MARHESELLFEYDSEHRARTVARSVRREVDEIGSDRSAARVARDGAAVTVTVEAEDLTALRAGGNTWLSLVEIAEKAADAGERYAR